MMNVVRFVVAATVCVFLGTPPLLAEDGIHCSEINNAYGEMLSADAKRSKDTVAQIKSLSPKQLDKQKGALAKKECSIAGEAIGIFNVIQVQTDACTAKGEQLGDFPDLVKARLKELRESIVDLCG